MVMNSMRDIRMGSDVFTSNGDKIGAVREVQGDTFKVDASMQPDYWLPFTSVTSAGPDGIRLGFDKDHLGDFKLDGPTARRPL